MAIDAVGGGASLLPASLSTPSAQPDPSAVQQFDQAMDAPALDDASVIDQIQASIRADSLRKILDDTLANSKKLFPDDDD